MHRGGHRDPRDCMARLTTRLGPAETGPSPVRFLPTSFHESSLTLMYSDGMVSESQVSSFPR